MPAMRFIWWKLSCFVCGLCMEALRKTALAALTCTFALCGSLIGSVSGALKGQTTETGLFRGAGIGVVAGAVVSVEILESCLQGGELLSKLAVFDSLLNGKVFLEWVSPAMLKAYQWQMNSVEAASENSDIFETPCNDGLKPNEIRMLPEFVINREDKDLCRKIISCAVCLQDFMYDESARRLPICGHIFHTACIDTWLLQHGSCPICRRNLRCIT